MFGRLLRILVGFIAACLGAGLAMVLFVVTPAELSGLPPDVATDRMTKALQLAVFVAAQTALFAAPLALVVAAVGEWRHNREWTYYAIAGIIIAVTGFLAQHSAEQVGQKTIVNNYAITAFVTAGFIGGLLYWLVSGRLAGGRRMQSLERTASKPATTTSHAGDAAPTTPAAPVAAEPPPPKS